MPRHVNKPTPIVPEWVKALPEGCLKSVADDAYTARRLAEEYGAPHNKKCAEILRAGDKSLSKLADRRASDKLRCAEGDRAARKFWEAKVCARRS